MVVVGGVWFLLVILPLVFPRTVIVPQEKLSTVSLVLTTLIGVGLGSEAFQRTKRDGE